MQPMSYYRCEHGDKHHYPLILITINAKDSKKAIWKAVTELLQELERLAQTWVDLNTTAPQPARNQEAQAPRLTIGTGMAAHPGCLPGWLEGWGCIFLSFAWGPVPTTPARGFHPLWNPERIRKQRVGLRGW